MEGSGGRAIARFLVDPLFQINGFGFCSRITALFYLSFRQRPLLSFSFCVLSVSKQFFL